MEITQGAFRPDLEPIWCRNTVKTPYCKGAIWGISPVFGPFSTLHSNAHNFANTQYFSAILQEIERAHSQLFIGGVSGLRYPLSMQLRLVKHVEKSSFLKCGQLFESNLRPHPLRHHKNQDFSAATQSFSTKTPAILKGLGSSFDPTKTD